MSPIRFRSVLTPTWPRADACEADQARCSSQPAFIRITHRQSDSHSLLSLLAAHPRPSPPPQLLAPVLSLARSQAISYHAWIGSRSFTRSMSSTAAASPPPSMRTASQRKAAAAESASASPPPVADGAAAAEVTQMQLVDEPETPRKRARRSSAKAAAAADGDEEEAATPKSPA